jgi:hypothetical protein
MAARSTFARLGFVVLMGVFGFSVLLQVFFAGEAALLAPDEWKTHLVWVRMFQWLSVPLPVTAHLAEHRIWLTAMSALPIALIGLQYSLIHIALARDDAVFAGLHAANGVLLFGTLVFIVQEWRYRAVKTSSVR